MKLAREPTSRVFRKEEPGIVASAARRLATSLPSERNRCSSKSRPLVLGATGGSSMTCCLEWTVPRARKAL
jgi:hypothetical protein